MGTDVGFYVNQEGIELHIPTDLEKLTMRVFTSGDIVSWPSLCGSNCSYTVTFDGPAYQCVDIQLPTISDFDSLSPTLWLYNTTLGIVNVSVTSPYDGTNITVEASDGIWIWREEPDDNFTHGTHCELYAATYTTKVNYSDNIPSVSANLLLHDQIFSSITEEILTLPGNRIPSTTTYALANFYAVEQAVEQLLQGYITLVDEGGQAEGTTQSIVIGGDSLVTLWNLVSTTNISLNNPITFPTNFSQRVEEVLMNTTISLANLLQRPSFGASPATYSLVNATIVSYPSLFVYSPRALWEIYGIALSLGCICVAIGLYFLFKSGVYADMSFSQVMVTTRNPRLDRLCYGAALGQDFISKELRRTKLRYGEPISMEDREDEVNQHVCFGLEKEVTAISKDRIYV